MEKFSRNPRRPPQFFHTVEIIFPWRGKSQNKLSIPWKTCAAGARQQLVADAPALQLARQRATAQLSGRGRRPQGAIDQTRARTRQRHTRHRAQRPHPQNAHRLFELRRQRQHAGQVQTIVSSHLTTSAPSRRPRASIATSRATSGVPRKSWNDPTTRTPNRRAVCATFSNARVLISKSIAETYGMPARYNASRSASRPRHSPPSCALRTVNSTGILVANGRARLSTSRCRRQSNPDALRACRSSRADAAHSGATGRRWRRNRQSSGKCQSAFSFQLTSLRPFKAGTSDRWQPSALSAPRPGNRQALAHRETARPARYLFPKVLTGFPLLMKTPSKEL